MPRDESVETDPTVEVNSPATIDCEAPIWRFGGPSHCFRPVRTKVGTKNLCTYHANRQPGVKEPLGKFVKWSDLQREAKRYREGFVQLFRENEGRVTDEVDGQGRQVKVTVRSFALHMGIPEQTFRDWVNPPKSTDTVDLLAPRPRPERPGDNLVSADQPTKPHLRLVEHAGKEQATKRPTKAWTRNTRETIGYLEGLADVLQDGTPDNFPDAELGSLVAAGHALQRALRPYRKALEGRQLNTRPRAQGGGVDA